MIKINIKQIPNGKWKENCYVVSNIKNNALIIDPGSDEKNIINYIKDNNLIVGAILNTHAHYDHVGAINKLKDDSLSDEDQALYYCHLWHVCGEVEDKENAVKLYQKLELKILQLALECTILSGLSIKPGRCLIS